MNEVFPLKSSTVFTVAVPIKLTYQYFNGLMTLHIIIPDLLPTGQEI